MSNIKFTMKDLDGTVMPYTSFVISTSTSANAASFTTNVNGEATVSLAAVSTPYYISKQDGTTESVIAYKFFVPDTTYTLDAELLFVDMGKISKDKNDKSIAALIEAKVVAVNAANRALQVVSLLGDVGTIRDNLANLVQVASNIDNIAAVVTNETNINTVASNTTNINKVATIDTNVTTVANSQTNVNTVATNIDNVNTVAPHTANIGTVATNVGNINTVAGSIASVNTTASNIANVNTVASNISNISTVAGISSAVSTVANNIEDIQTTAEGIGLIPDVLPYTSNITTVANNIAPIIAVGNNINNINEVRAMEADIEVLADEIANIAGAAAAVTQAVDAQKVLYVAGTDYTKNTSNTLTLPYFPAKSNSVKIFFDGAYKNKDTWNRVGKNIAFTSVIDADKVEIQYEVPSSFVGLSPEDILVIQNAEAAAQASEVDAQQSATAAAVSASLAQGVANQAVDAIKQLFVAGTGFTKGVSTQLTMDFLPVKTNAVKVFFGGVYQNKDTFTRVGKVITFNEAINVDNVEIHYEVPSQFVGLDADDNAVLVAAQNAAQASANAAAASFDSFDDRYLGAKNVAPALDNDGNALLVGTKYFNSTENKMYVRNTSNAWQLDTADSSTVNYDGGTVQDVLDSTKSIADYTALRAYTGRATSVRITTPGIAGFFRRNGSAADNGGTVIVDGSGRSWERVFDGAVNVKWFGAKGDDVTDDTVAIQAALNSGVKNIFLPEGSYRVTTLTIPADYITLFGSGQGGHSGGGSRLISIGAGTDVIYARQRFKLTFKNFRIETSGGRNNRDGFHFDGCVWTILDTIHVHQMGRHGVLCEDTGTIYNGCYPVIINKCHVVGCTGDGVNIVAKSGSVQMNGVYISNCELQSCDGNGAVLWGLNVVVRDSISEGHKQYGIKLANGLSTGVYTAEAVTIDSCYFEKNDLGSIYGEVGQRGSIVGLHISGNFGVFDEGTQATYVPVRFTATGSTAENGIRGLTYRGNSFHSSSTGTLPDTEADFEGAPNTSSTIYTAQSLASTSSFALFTIVSKFKNLGYAQLNTGIKTKVLSGLLQAKGGTGIIYSGLEKSDNVTTTGANTYFPVDIPIGTRIDRYQVPVDTDSTNYTIRFQLLKKSNESLGAYSDMHNIIKQTLSAGATVVQTGSILQYTANPRKDGIDESDTVLKITVTWSVVPTYFYIGNPTIFHS